MKLFYRKTGSGKPMVILHGLYGSSDNWQSIARSLSGNFEVYTPDLRNHGRSPHDENHDYELIREDLEVFMDEHNLKDPVIVGHSMGGKAAMCFARNNPGRVGKLVIVDIAPKSYKDLYRREAVNHYDILMAMKSIDFRAASTRRDVDHQLSGTIKPDRVRSFLMKNLGQDKDGNYKWNINLDVLIRELDNIMDGINRNCFNPDFPVSGFPVLFVRGGKSPYILDEDMDSIRGIFPDAKLITIKDAGHWLHAEKPQEFVEAVKGFSL